MEGLTRRPCWGAELVCNAAPKAVTGGIFQGGMKAGRERGCCRLASCLGAGFFFFLLFRRRAGTHLVSEGLPSLSRLQMRVGVQANAAHKLHLRTTHLMTFSVTCVTGSDFRPAHLDCFHTCGPPVRVKSSLMEMRCDNTRSREVVS